jgi:hypothetical protein
VLIGWNVSSPTTSSTVTVRRRRSASRSNSSRREVQAGRGCRGRAGLAGEDGLVAIGVARRSSMYGGSGISPWRSSSATGRRHRSARPRTCRPPACAPPSDTSGTSPLSNRSPTRSFAPGRTKRLPDPAVGVTRLQQQHFGRSPGRTAQPEPRRDDPGLVEHEQVPGAQQLGQVGDATVLGRCAPPIDEQPRGVTRLDRCLRDPIVRQLVVEVGELHPAEANETRGQTPCLIQSNRLLVEDRRGIARPRCS